MGIVFSPEAIKDGRIPEPGAHLEAAKEAMQFLKGSAENFEGLASGFLIYGSVPAGAATLRSDLDLLVSPYHIESRIPRAPEGPGATLKRNLHEKYFVPLEAHVLPLDIFWAEDHAIDPLLLDHLLEAQENALYSHNWPVNRYRDYDSSQLDTRQIAGLIHRYASRKLSFFANAEFHCSGEPDLKVFQRALELPKALGRKLLRLHGDEDLHVHTPAEAFAQFRLRIATNSSLDQDYSLARNALASPEPHKSAVAYMEDPGNQLSFDLHVYRNFKVVALAKLAQMDDEYNSVLDDALRTREIRPYNTWLHANFLSALHLGQTVAAACVSYYSPRKDTPLGGFPQTLSEFQAEVTERLSLESEWEY